jgi:hypothetical protein
MESAVIAYARDRLPPQMFLNSHTPHFPLIRE